MEHNFKIIAASSITNFGTEYDYNSIMHYGRYDFSVNGLPTITPKVSQLSNYFSLSK
jgi:hypothetical protein